LSHFDASSAFPAPPRRRAAHRHSAEPPRPLFVVGDLVLREVAPKIVFPHHRILPFARDLEEKA
jgi:hypothetical protein